MQHQFTLLNILQQIDLLQVSNPFGSTYIAQTPANVSHGFLLAISIIISFQLPLELTANPVGSSQGKKLHIDYFASSGQALLHEILHPW